MIRIVSFIVVGQRPARKARKKIRNSATRVVRAAERWRQ